MSTLTQMKLYSSLLRMLEYAEMDGNFSTLATAIDNLITSSTSQSAALANLLTGIGVTGGRTLVGGATDDGVTDLQVGGPAKATRVLQAVAALTPGATVALDASQGSLFTLTPGQTCTINATNPVAGHEIALAITTSGTTSYTLTFGSGFKTTGTLATGAVSARTFVIRFVCFDGATYVESGRTAAMA